MTIWQNDNLTKWQFDKMTIWQMTIWQNDKMTIRQNDNLTKWQFDKMTIWQNSISSKWPIKMVDKWSFFVIIVWLKWPCNEMTRSPKPSFSYQNLDKLERISWGKTFLKPEIMDHRIDNTMLSFLHPSKFFLSPSSTLIFHKPFTK